MMTNRLNMVTPTLSGTDATDVNYTVNPTAFTAKILSLKIIPATSVSTHAANYITITVKSGSTTLATFTTNSSGGAALTAGTVVTMTLTGAGTELEIAAAGVVTVEVAKAGTGPAYKFAVLVGFEAIH